MVYFLMKIIIGTKSERKVDSIKKILNEFIKKDKIEIIPFDANSNVSETPWDKETYKGSRNRALDCKANINDADYWIGIESGLAKRYGNIYEEAWCCIIGKEGKEYFGYSSGLKVPDFILKKMEEHQTPHYLIFSKLNKHHNKDINSDTWGQYSGNMVLRQVSIDEAIRNTAIQVFTSENSYYNK